MSVALNVKRKGDPNALLKEFQDIKKPAYQDLGVHFHQVNLPRRFTWAGGRMLGYAMRVPRYTKRKEKEKGHFDPLRWSDTSRRLALSIQDVRVDDKKNKTELRIVLHARGLNRRNPKSKIRMNEEVRRISPREYGPLTRVLDNSIQHRIAQRKAVAP